MSFLQTLGVNRRLRIVSAIRNLGAGMMLYAFLMYAFNQKPLFGLDLFAIFLLGGVVGYVSLLLVVRCPSCGLNFTRHARSNVPLGEIDSWLETFEQCPRCHFQPTETKATTDVILSSFSTLVGSLVGSLWQWIEAIFIVTLLTLSLPLYTLLRSRWMQYLYRQRHGDWLVPVWAIAIVVMFAPFFAEAWLMKMWAGDRGEIVLAAYFAIPVSAVLLTLWWQRSPYGQLSTPPPTAVN